MDNERKFASRFDNVSGSAIREIFKVIAKPNMISFAGGNPAMSSLPDEMVEEIASDCLKKDGKRILQYGATEGYPPLNESLKQYVNDNLDINTDDCLILPTTGSTQGMDLLCKALINPGDVILSEDPTFLGNLQCMNLYEAKVIGVESDKHGIIPASLEESVKKYKPKMLYTIPNFQNPGGTTLSEERRKPIAEIAAKYNFVIVEDDPYRALRYKGEHLHTIKHYDTANNVVYLGSFSKIISPGLRVGFMISAPDISRKCTIGKQSSDVHTANLTQAIVDGFIRRDLLPKHIESIRSDYKIKLESMAKHLDKFPKGTDYNIPDGGMFIFITLPEEYNASELLSKAVEKHVAYVPGTHFFINGGHNNTLRLNFTNSTPEDINKGMQILCEIFN